MRPLFRALICIEVLASLLSFSSCSDEFLKKEPIGVGAGSVMTTPDGIESILIGAYSGLKGRYMFGGNLCTDWVYGSVASDDCYKGTSSGDSSPMSLVESFICWANCSYMKDRWTDCYNGVAGANSVLEFLDQAQEGKTPLPAARAIQVEAEAKFLRAWFHFQANKVFEHIPYIKTLKELAPLLPEEVSNPDPAWDEIEEDLQFAIDNLPENFPGEPGRTDKYAAMAVKAHAHMYQKEFDQARILLDDIINNGGFSLAGHFYDNYDMTHENNSESIFELQASTTPTAHTSMMISGAVFHQKGPVGSACGGWGFFQPSQCLFEAFQVTPDGLPVLEIDEREPLANDMGLWSSTQFIPTDHLLDPRVDWTKPAANYKIESYPPGHPAFSSQTEARKAVRMEIRLEFATEGHRFFDLRRWGIDDEVLNDFIARDLTFRTTMREAVYDPVKNDYWPLPQSQVDLQKGILLQDSSYIN